MSNFDKIYGEGSLEKFLNNFNNADLFPSVLLDTPGQDNDGNLNGQIKLIFDDSSTVTILYSADCWEFLQMESAGEGLLEKFGEVLPPFAKNVLEVQIFKCTVLSDVSKSIFAKAGFEGTKDLELPIERAMEYSDWLNSGKALENEPDWRKNLE